MDAQTLLIITNLIPLVAGHIQAALKALLGQAGIDPDKLLEAAAQNNHSALTMIEAEINRVGASLPPSQDKVATGNALIADLKKKK